MFVDVAVMEMMQVPIVQIVCVTLVCYGCMSTLGAVGVTMGSVLFTCCFHEKLTSVVIRRISL